MQIQIDVPSSATSMRFGVREIETRKMGSMEAPLPLASAQ
jgi:hypothetical protein